MAIVKMKRLRLIGLTEQRDSLLRKLQSFGCLELSAQEPRLEDPEWASSVHIDDNQAAKRGDELAMVSSALAALDTYAYVKSPMFALRPEVTEKQLFDDTMLADALSAANKIMELDSRIRSASTQESKIASAKTSLLPWSALDVPLEMEGTRTTAIRFGVCPITVDFAQMQIDLAAVVPEAQLYRSSSDREQHYMLLMVYRSLEEDAMNVLRGYGWSAAALKGFEGSAKDNIARVDEAAAGYAKRKQLIVEELAEMGAYRDELKLAYERLTQEVSREAAQGKLLSTEKTFFLEGWVTVPQLDKLEKLLADYICAYELTDPVEGDSVPVKLQSNRFTEPLNMVTEMYSLPAYDGVDPNPLILPFFTMFFGIMYADIGYGLILIIGSLIINRKFKPRGTVGQMIRLATLCGVTTLLWGVLFGSCFGDAIPVFENLIGVEQTKLWCLINPLENPMVALIGSLAIGCFQIIVGMAINAIMLIRDGKPLDALFDVGSWWLLFAGLALGALGKGWYVCLGGVAALVLTQGRDKPTFVGKLIGGLASLYDITSYFGDVLSYSRLMALMLASSVIASVVNVLGSLSGSVIVFIIVFLIGHAFNMGINIIGTYVHAARLQYLEFFGKFYREGGRAFAPLAYKTKYTDIIKEEN